MWFKHFCKDIVFILPPPTIRDAKKQKQNQPTKQKIPNQTKNLKLSQRSKVVTSVFEASSIRVETFTTKLIYTNNMVESMCESLCFQSQQECKAHYRWSKDICRLKVSTVSSDWMGQHRTVNDKTHRVNRNPTMTGERVLKVLQVTRPAVAVIHNSHQCLRELPHCEEPG